MPETIYENDEVSPLDGQTDAFSGAATKTPSTYEQFGSMPTPDFAGAAQARKDIIDKKVAAIDSSMAGARKAENLVDRTSAELQSFDPNQVKEWDFAKEQAKYKTPPLEQFGSFAMIAALGMAAFTRQPFNSSLNAMAGVMNGIRESDDQAYDRAYTSWKANNDLLFKRYDVMKSQFTSAMDLWKTKGEMGRQDLQNTLTKYGMLEQKALLDYGMDDLFFTWADKHSKAMEGLRKEAQNMENYNLVKQAIPAENESRRQNGLPPMTAGEEIQFKTDLVAPRTPEQRIMMDAYKSFLSENPKADAWEKAEFWNNLKFNQRAGSGKQTTVDEIYRQKLAEFEEANGRKPTADESTEILKEIKYKGENPAAARKTEVAEALRREAEAKNDGKPLTAQQLKKIDQEAEEKSLGATRKDELRGLVDRSTALDKLIRRAELIAQQNGMIVGATGAIRQPAEIVGNVTGLWNATQKADFDRLVSMIQSMAPRIFNESVSRPLAAEHGLVERIVPGMDMTSTTQNFFSSMRELKSLTKEARSRWISRINNEWEAPGTTKPGGSTGGAAPWLRDKTIQ